MSDATTLLRDMAGDAATNVAGKVNPSEEALARMDEPAADHTWHEKPDFSKENMKAQAQGLTKNKNASQDARATAERTADAARNPDGSIDAQAGAKTAVNLTTLATGSGSQAETEAPVDFSPLADLVNSLYNGNYRSFFVALAAVEDHFLTQDRYLHEHRAWFVREMRLRAYQQLLQSYRVVGLNSMASDFGVTVDYLDRYVSFYSIFFIALPFLSCSVFIGPFLFFLFYLIIHSNLCCHVVIWPSSSPATALPARSTASTG